MKSTKKPLSPSPKPVSKKTPSNSQFHHDITALKAENLKFQKQIAKLKAEQISLCNKIIILEENNNERCVHESPPYECLVKARQILEEKIQEYEKKLSNRNLK